MAEILVSALGLLAAVAAHAASCRAGMPHIRALVYSLVTGLLAIGVLAIVLADTLSLAVLTFVACSALYSCWWYVFLNFVQALESSLRVRLLSEIAVVDQPLDLETLMSRYNDRAILTLRVNRLRD